MRLLFLTPQPPYPPEQGAALRNWGLIRELSKRHEVHLLTFADGAVEQPGLASVTTIPLPHRTTRQRLQTLVTSPDPDMARRLGSSAFAAALEELLTRYPFDVVQVEGIEMVPYALPYLSRTQRPRFVYDAHNAEADLQASAFRADIRQPRRLPHALYSAIQTLKLRLYEQRILQAFDVVCAVSETDVEILKSLGGATPFFLPNGIDTEAVTPDSATPALEMAQRTGPHLVFTGKLDFRPNVDALLWFTQEILPRITTEQSKPTLWAVGQSPHASLAPLRHHPQVVLTGRVPAVEPYIAGADVVVVPLRMGSGTRLKVLQALSMAKPVVGTTLGCAGLGLHDGEHLLLADDPATFAAATSRLIATPDEGIRLGEKGRHHVQSYFDWRVLVPTLEKALSEGRVS
jgi:glycosyltransferase involved in cell wall biosynthesis